MKLLKNFWKNKKIPEKNNFQENNVQGDNLTEEECSICFEKIMKNEIVVLPCLHKLDIKCYEKYRESVKERISSSFNCPICRNPIELGTDRCMICQELLEKDKMNYLKNVKCGCEYHYTCYNDKNPSYYRTNKHRCSVCSVEHRPEDMEVYSYLYFPEGYETWISEIKGCQQNNCHNIGNPKCGNYCDDHKKFTVKNREVVKAFKYFTQKGIGMSRDEKEKLFLKMMKKGEKV